MWPKPYWQGGWQHYGIPVGCTVVPTGSIPGVQLRTLGAIQLGLGEDRSMEELRMRTGIIYDPLPLLSVPADWISQTDLTVRFYRQELTATIQEVNRRRSNRRLVTSFSLQVLTRSALGCLEISPGNSSVVIPVVRSGHDQVGDPYPHGLQCPSRVRDAATPSLGPCRHPDQQIVPPPPSCHLKPRAASPVRRKGMAWNRLGNRASRLLPGVRTARPYGQETTSANSRHSEWYKDMIPGMIPIVLLGSTVYLVREMIYAVPSPGKDH